MAKGQGLDSASGVFYSVFSVVLFKMTLSHLSCYSQYRDRE